VQTLTEAEQTIARQNIYAAPFDALAYNGMQINGGFDVSQEKGTSGLFTAGYAVDGWLTSYQGTMAIATFQVVTGAYFAANCIVASVSTAQTSLGTNDQASVVQPIEGHRWARLGWGTPQAQPVTVGFWTCHARPGTYSVRICNKTTDRSYATTYTQNAPTVWEYKTVTIPGCVDGTWEKTNLQGAYVLFAMAAGTGLTAPAANTWFNANYAAAPGQVNAVSSTSDVFRITGIVVLPGIEAPSAARSPLIMRPYDQELVTCQRYYRQLGGAAAYEMLGNGQPHSTGGANVLLFFGPPMRASPAITPVGNLALTNATTAGLPVTAMALNSSSPVSASLNVSVASGLIAGNVTLLMTNNDLNARLKLEARL
jgi:hypothetical protein